MYLNTKIMFPLYVSFALLFFIEVVVTYIEISNMVLRMFSALKDVWGYMIVGQTELS